MTAATPTPALHTVVPVLEEGGAVRWDVACHAGPEAYCRARWDDCGCEAVTGIERRPDGRWQHQTLDDAPVTHVMEPGADECHQLSWLTADPSLILELYTGDETELRSGAIDLSWEGEGYSWEYADEDRPVRLVPVPDSVVDPVVVEAGDPLHVLQLSATGWTVQHPLACRLGDLFTCAVTAAAQRLEAPPREMASGRYHVAADPRTGELLIGDEAPS